MKVFKRNFILLFICAGFLLSSCNISPNFLSWLFGNKLSSKVVAKNTKSSFTIGKALFWGVLAIGAGFVFYKLLSKKGSNNQLDKSDDKKEVGSELEIKPEGKPESEKEKLIEVAGDAKAAVGKFIDAARAKDILKNHKKLELPLKNGKKAINNIYLLKVAKQSDCSCGPRALYNCQAMGEIITFDAEKKVFTVCFDKLDYLNKVVGEKDKELENPRLLEFFKVMHDARDIGFIFKRDNFKCDDKTENLKEYDYNKDTGEIVGLNYQDKVVKGFDAKENRIFTKFKFGKDNAVQWAGSSEMRSFISDCNKQKKCKFKFDEITVYEPWYYLYFKPKSDFVQMILYKEDKSIGCRRNFVITHETAPESNTYHYVSVNVIKTGENEFDWFVCDSLYDTTLDNKELVGYIEAMTSDN